MELNNGEFQYVGRGSKTLELSFSSWIGRYGTRLLRLAVARRFARRKSWLPSPPTMFVVMMPLGGGGEQRRRNDFENILF